MDQKQKQNLLRTIRELKQSDEKVFLVGGAVRDQILRLPVHDLDFTVRGNPESLARKLANHLKAGFYILDDLRHTARVVWKRDFEESTTLDFSKFRGVSIEDDLRGRDFTLNAIAVDLDHPSKLVDPLKGREALKAHHLRLCSPDSLMEDPIRVLRAIRFAVKFDLKIDSSVMKSLKKTAPLLLSVSRERQRDELFQILMLEQTSRGIELLDDLSVMDMLFPVFMPLRKIELPHPHDCSVWEHTKKVVKGLDLIRRWIGESKSAKENAILLEKPFLHTLFKYFPQLEDYLASTVTLDRSRYSLLQFSALFHDAGVMASQSNDWDGMTHFYYHEKISADIAQEHAKEFALSNHEQDFIRRIVLNHSQPRSLSESVYPLDDQMIYQFYKATGDAGVAVCLLGLADLMAKHNLEVPLGEWKKELDIVAALFYAWWKKSGQIVNPKPLITGDELKKNFAIAEGPRIGDLLESLKEAQASGEVKTHKQAVLFIKKCLDSGSRKR